jgi:hypothetical protein
MTIASAERKSGGWRRWAGVILRSVHLVAVIALGAGLLGAPIAVGNAATAVLFSGLAMFGLDIWSKPGHLHELSGVSMLLKLALVLWMAVDATQRTTLFWLVVAGSALVAHAPARFRHAQVCGQKIRARQ